MRLLVTSALRSMLLLSAFALSFTANIAFASGNNPCAANPCAANPCAANPCAANPCAANPCAANPCAANMNPCAVKAITRPVSYTPMKGNHKALAAMGKKLFHDASLSTNGGSCATCHADHGLFKSTFLQPYPHRVSMAKSRFGLNSIHLDEMVQLCMVVPMESKPLLWNSKELAALVAYVEDVQQSFIAEHAAKK